MKLCLVLATLAALAAAQSTTLLREIDINGRRVETAVSGRSDGTTTEVSRSINGNRVPIEQTEEKVLSETSTGKVTERTVRKYDPNGRVSSTERVRIEEEKSPGGGSTVRQTTWRSDINGNQNEAERRTIETRVSGATTTTDISIARPSINGSFETAEKRIRVAEKSGDTEQASEIVQLRGGDGRFADAMREVTVTSRNATGSKEDRTIYEPGMNGALELSRQTVSSSTKRPDGTEVTEVNLYARSAGGQAQNRGDAPQIKEQQIIERTKAADGTVVESFSVRQPSVSDPSRLGSLQKLSETVCKGDCK